MITKIKKEVDNVLNSLTDQEKIIISKRYGLIDGVRSTFNEVAEEFNLTRERIRQIQNKTLAKLAENKCLGDLAFSTLQVERAISKCGGISTDKDICELCSCKTEKEKVYIKLILDIGKKFKVDPLNKDTNRYWYLDENKKKAFDKTAQALHKELNKDRKKIYTLKEIENIVETIVGKKLKTEHVKNLLEISTHFDKNFLDEWGHKNNIEIRLKSISGYIKILLRKEGVPMHIKDIYRKVEKLSGKKSSIGNCHNSLIGKDDFVLIGQGIYALKDNGYRKGYLIDIISLILNEKGPLKMSEIIKEVTKERKVKDRSIHQALYNRERFMKNDKGAYTTI